MLTLWDFLEPKRRKARKQRARKSARTTGAPRTVTPKPGSMAQQYETLTQHMLKEHNIKVRKWRTSMSGVAWEVCGSDGNVTKLIEAPRPKGPMSCAIFLHEIGHHAIGFRRYRPRCLEEYHAWKWSLNAMERQGMNITDAVHHRMHESLWYAISKAHRRGLRRLPGELLPYAHPPQPRASRKTPATLKT